MIQLYDVALGTLIGSITEAELQLLIDQLEEESAADQEYYLSEATIDMLEENGADGALADMLRTALGGREGFDVRWARS